MDSLKSLAKETSKLRIGFAANVIPALNAETLIMDFRKKYPAVELSISNFTDYECEEALLNRKIDFAFSMGPFLSSRIQSTLLVNEPIHALLSVKHPLSDRKALTMEDLADKPLILADSRNKGHAQTRSFIQKKWGHINIIFQTNDPVTHLHMVSKQMGISLFPDHLKPIFEKAEGVRILPITDHPQRSIYLIFEPQTMPPRCMQQFMKFTIAFYKDT